MKAMCVCVCVWPCMGGMCERSYIHARINWRNHSNFSCFVFFSIARCPNNVCNKQLGRSDGTKV